MVPCVAVPCITCMLISFLVLASTLLYPRLLLRVVLLDAGLRLAWPKFEYNDLLADMFCPEMNDAVRWVLSQNGTGPELVNRWVRGSVWGLSAAVPYLFPIYIRATRLVPDMYDFSIGLSPWLTWLTWRTPPNFRRRTDSPWIAERWGVTTDADGAEIRYIMAADHRDVVWVFDSTGWYGYTLGEYSQVLRASTVSHTGADRYIRVEADDGSIRTSPLIPINGRLDDNDPFKPHVQDMLDRATNACCLK